MEKQTVNRLYDGFLNGQNNFSELYNSLVGLRTKILNTLDEHTKVEIFDDCILSVVSKRIPNEDFYNYVSRSLRNAKMDYLRKQKKRRDFEVVSEFIEETAATVSDDYSVTKREAEHRQVIDFLLAQAPTDAITTAIVNGVLNSTSPDVTPNGIGIQLGCHPQQIRRKLRKLSRYYDEAVFGSFHGLLA